MKLDKIINIVSILCLLLFIIFLIYFGPTELLLGSQNANMTQQNVTQQDDMMKGFRFFSGLFLGLGWFFLNAFYKKNQPNDLNYVEAKINSIFDQNFLFEIKSSYERLKTIEYEILEYEFNAYIDIAIEISKIKQESFNKKLPVAYSIAALIIAFNVLFQLLNTNPNFLSGFILGSICVVLILIFKIVDTIEKWNRMYYDLMLLKSNRKNNNPSSILGEAVERSWEYQVEE